MQQAHRRRSGLGRWSAAALLAAGATLLVAGPAAAEVSGPCDGEVTIDGVTYGPANDSASNPIVVPADAEMAAWRGTTGVAITDHSGRLAVVIGPGSVEIASWSGENADLETSAEGVYEIADAREQLPVDVVGLYELTGSHAGSGGTCTGSVMVRIEGSPLTTPLGAGAAAVTILGLAGVALAGAGGAGTTAATTSATTGTAGTTTEVH